MAATTLTLAQAREVIPTLLMDDLESTAGCGCRNQ